MKAVILARVSTEEQKEAGNSLPAQIARLEEYCRRKGFDVIERHSFDESAYKAKRDEFDRILAFLKSAKEKIAVCFDKVDRFSRNVFDKRVAILNELVMQGKIELHFVSDNLVITDKISAVEKFHFGINLGLAKYYSDAISDNTKRALEQRLRNGECIGKARIGYINTTDEKGKKDIQPDPEKAHFIPQVFELYASRRYSVKMLADEMAKRGLRGYAGKPLVPSMIYKILTDPFYHGEQLVKGVLYPHKYKPLISYHLFRAVQAVLAEHQKKPFQYAAKIYIFRGLITCDRCGCMITPETKKGRYVYYSCTNFKRMCKRVWVKEETLLDAVYKALDGLQMTQERIDEVISGLKAAHEAKNAYHDNALRALRTEYDKTEQRIKNLFTLFLDGSITKEIYDENLKTLKEKELDLQIQMDEHTKADETWYVTASRVLDVAKRAHEIFMRSEAHEKRQFLNFLLQNCRLQGKNLVFDLRKPFDSIALYANHPTSLRTLDDVRTVILQGKSSFPFTFAA